MIWIAVKYSIRIIRVLLSIHHLILSDSLKQNAFFCLSVEKTVCSIFKLIKLMKSCYAVRCINVSIKYNLKLVLPYDNIPMTKHTKLGQRFYLVLLII